MFSGGTTPSLLRSSLGLTGFQWLTLHDQGKWLSAVRMQYMYYTGLYRWWRHHTALYPFVENNIDYLINVLTRLKLWTAPAITCLMLLSENFYKFGVSLKVILPQWLCHNDWQQSLCIHIWLLVQPNQCWMGQAAGWIKEGSIKCIKSRSGWFLCLKLFVALMKTWLWSPRSYLIASVTGLICGT